MAGAIETLAHRKQVYLPSKDRMYFTANLALLLQAAVPLGDILTSMQQATKSSKFKKILDDMKSDIAEGMPLWKVMERSRIVSWQTVSLAKLGEESGNLAQNLKIAAQQEQKQHALRSKITTAMLYPAFVFGITIVVGIGIVWFLLPRLADTFAGLGVDLPLITQIVIAIGKFVGQNGFWLIPAVIGVITLLVYVLFIAKATKSIGRSLLFHTPGVSRLMQEVEVASFGYLFGTLLGAGLSVTQSLRMMYEAENTPEYKKLYSFLYNSFDDGYNLKTSLDKYKNSQKLLPPTVQQIAIAGESSGNLSQSLLEIGKIYEEKSDTTAQNLQAVLEPILLVIVWLGVLSVAVAVILPIYSLVGGLQA
ncbi:MAG: type II secretion system F family protein [Candidatus Woesebacteria bacterium]